MSSVDHYEILRDESNGTQTKVDEAMVFSDAAQKLANLIKQSHGQQDYSIKPIFVAHARLCDDDDTPAQLSFFNVLNKATEEDE